MGAPAVVKLVLPLAGSSQLRSIPMSYARLARGVSVWKEPRDSTPPALGLGVVPVSCEQLARVLSASKEPRDSTLPAPSLGEVRVIDAQLARVLFASKEPGSGVVPVSYAQLARVVLASREPRGSAILDLGCVVLRAGCGRQATILSVQKQPHA